MEATPAQIFDNFWFFWIVMFILVEVAALMYNKRKNPEKYQGGTLTEMVRRMAHESRAVKVIFIVFFVYLGLHFAEVSIGNFAF